VLFKRGLSSNQKSDTIDSHHDHFPVSRLYANWIKRTRDLGLGAVSDLE
jgi:hypothetical protein